MLLDVTRFARSTVFGSLVPLVAIAAVAACSAAPGEATSTQTESVVVLHTLQPKSLHHSFAHMSHCWWDDVQACHPAPVGLCPLLDSEFIGQDGGAACAHVTTSACPDRVDTWVSAIVFDFAIAVTNDCRFGEWAPPLLTDADVATYLNDLNAFTLQFMGCPAEGTTTPLSFGLIPSALDGNQFTTADLAALANTYIQAITQAVSDNGSPPLSSDELDAIHAKLIRLARHVPNTVPSGAFTFSTCVLDGSAQSGASGLPVDGVLDCDQ
jgi:hypothetical protein